MAIETLIIKALEFGDDNVDHLHFHSCQHFRRHQHHRRYQQCIGGLSIARSLSVGNIEKTPFTGKMQTN